MRKIAIPGPSAGASGLYDLCFLPATRDGPRVCGSVEIAFAVGCQVRRPDSGAETENENADSRVSVEIVKWGNNEQSRIEREIKDGPGMLNMQKTAKWAKALDLLPTEKMDCPQSSASARHEAVGHVCNRDVSRSAFPSKSASPVACAGGIAIAARLLVGWLQAAKRRELACYRNGIRNSNLMD